LIPKATCRHFFRRKKCGFARCAFSADGRDDVAGAVGRVAVGQPLNGTVEIGGPETFRIDELVRRRLAPLNDSREVIADPNALYSGAKLDERTLVPGKDARLGATSFETWLTQSAGKATRRVPLEEESLIRFQNSFGIGVPDVLPIGPLHPQEAQKRQSDAVFQDWRLSRQGRPDDHGGVSAGQHGPNPSAQRTWVHLRTGRLNRDAGESGKEVTLTPGQTFYEGPDDVHVVGATPARQTGEIRRVLREGQRRSHISTREVGQDRTCFAHL